jgi:hypothetical protein
LSCRFRLALDNESTRKRVFVGEKAGDDRQLLVAADDLEVCHGCSSSMMHAGEAMR